MVFGESPQLEAGTSSEVEIFGLLIAHRAQTCMSCVGPSLTGLTFTIVGLNGVAMMVRHLKIEK